MAAEDAGALIPGRLAASFERWTVTIPTGTERPTGEREWAGALVIVEQGAIEVVCRGGARRSFGRGSFLSLSWLPVVRLCSRGAEDAVLVGYRRIDQVDRVGEALGVPYPA